MNNKTITLSIRVTPDEFRFLNRFKEKEHFIINRSEFLKSAIAIGVFYPDDYINLLEKVLLKCNRISDLENSDSEFKKILDLLENHEIKNLENIL